MQLGLNCGGIVLVTDGQKKLLDTITDGDLRRALLGGVGKKDSVSTILAHKASWFTEHYGAIAPVTTMPYGSSQTEIAHIMAERNVRQIPLVNQDNQVVDIALISDILDENDSEVLAVLMAGGFGTRLRPLTETTPKPMLLLGGKPIMEYLVDQLRETGVNQAYVTTHYRRNAIMEHFGDGQGFGVDINYIEEDSPLGTAGALGRIGRPDAPVIVVNGDILTSLNFKAMVDFHLDNHADLTVAVRIHETTIPYGVIEMEKLSVSAIKEKPVIRSTINAGIYVLSPVAFDWIKPESFMPMTDLIENMLAAGRKIVGFPMHEYWRDIGQIEDFRQAEVDITDIHQGRVLYWPE